MVGKRQTISKSEPKVAKAFKFADCRVCARNLSKWGVGGNGSMCPPCTDFQRSQDMQLREHVAKVCGKAVGLYVPADSSERVRVIDLSEKSPVGKVVCPVYHSLGVRAKTTAVIYDAEMDDQAMNKMLDYNVRAARLGSELKVFHVDSTWYGPIVFMGPGNMTLLPREIKSFKRKIK